jgi:tungstate transport system substrate-binding protein
MVDNDGARAFSEFIRGREAQEIIRGFGVEQFGQPLFFADAGK